MCTAQCGEHQASWRPWNVTYRGSGRDERLVKRKSVNCEGAAIEEESALANRKVMTWMRTMRKYRQLQKPDSCTNCSIDHVSTDLLWQISPHSVPLRILFASVVSVH